MPYRGLIATLGVLVCLAGPALAQQASRLAPAESEAFAFRRLQSELMVAALSCNDMRHRDAYNTFVHRFRPALSENARVLKAYFKRHHGSAATRRLDAFITGLANDASLASMGDRNFCVNALARFEAINRTDEDQTAGRIVEEAELLIDQ